jgi:hypothetical protein
VKSPKEIICKHIFLNLKGVPNEISKTIDGYDYSSDVDLRSHGSRR